MPSWRWRMNGSPYAVRASRTWDWSWSCWRRMASGPSADCTATLCFLSFRQTVICLKFPSLEKQRLVAENDTSEMTNPELNSLFFERISSMSFHPSAPLPVAVLGATSPLGQHLVARLTAHPWFKLVAVAETGMEPGASAARCWHPPASGAPVACLSLPLLPYDPTAFPGVKIIFSALSTPDANKVEAACAEAG